MCRDIVSKVLCEGVDLDGIREAELFDPRPE
jgi:hypothetical protein